MTHVELEHTLLDRATSVVAAMLRILQIAPPHVCRLPALAVVLNAKGEGGLLVIEDIEHRVELLAAHAKEHGTVGFAIVYDGYVSHQCKLCENKGCDDCAGMDKRRCDSIMAIIRTTWGFSHSKSHGYDWDSAGQFVLKSEFDFEFAGAKAHAVLDRYDAVFAPATVN